MRRDPSCASGNPTLIVHAVAFDDDGGGGGGDDDGALRCAGDVRKAGEPAVGSAFARWSRAAVAHQMSCDNVREAYCSQRSA